MVVAIVVEEAVRLSWWIAKGGGAWLWWGVSRAIWGAPPTPEELERRKLQAIKDTVRDEVERATGELEVQLEQLRAENAELLHVQRRSHEERRERLARLKQEGGNEA